MKQLFRKAVGFDATEADSPEENNALDRTGHEGHSPDAILGRTKRSLRDATNLWGTSSDACGFKPKSVLP